MEHDNNQISGAGHFLTIAFVATFAGLRHFILIVCLLGILTGVAIVWFGRGPVVVNHAPVCNRVWFVTPSDNDPLKYVSSFVRSAQGQTYVHEADGTGYCLLKHEEGWNVVEGIYVQRWWEIPTKYPEMIAQQIPTKNHLPTLGFAIGGFSVMLLFFLWLPATLLAMFGRRLMKNARQEHYEQF